jgi:hypothetical protein
MRYIVHLGSEFSMETAQEIEVIYRKINSKNQQKEIIQLLIRH